MKRQNYSSLIKTPINLRFKKFSDENASTNPELH